MKIVTSEQMRGIDRRATDEFGIPSLLLMENAAGAAADVIQQHYADVERVAIFCGPGQNGGDGFALARLMSTRGVTPSIFIAGDRAKIRGDAALNLAICERLRLPMFAIDDADAVSTALAMASQEDLVVDAIFGTGLSRPAEGLFADLIAGFEELRLPVVALDVPSGIDASKHVVTGPTVRADLTIAFELPKICHVFEPAASWCGEVVVAAISIPDAAVEAEGVTLSLTLPAEVVALVPPRHADTHKGTYGHVGVIAGGPGHSGAAILAARGALRMGAGLVTILSDAETCRIADCVSVETMTQQFDLRDASALERFDAFVVGPGLPEDEESKAAVRRLVASLEKAVVLDAGALNAFQGHELQRPAGVQTVMTPHPGELSRLANATTAEINADRVLSAKIAAEHAGFAVVLKGHQTIIAEPSGPIAVNSTGNPGMATGGMGDVLSGMIATLLAQGDGGFEAARAAVYLHGLAGDIVMERSSDTGLAAMDVADAVPLAVARVREIAR